MPEHHEVAIVGAGFGGLGMAIRLRRSGRRFVVLEKADRVGGTWRENTYPGAGCDVPSHLYSFSFHPGRWARRYAGQAEILRYLEELAEAHGLGPHLRFGAEVRSAEFDEDTGAWRLVTGDGRALTAGAVVSSVGQLNRPALAEIPGRERFLGPSWHTAHWHHDCPLDGRRVAVIGTGASAIQVVPEIAPRAGRLHVFQRSAPYVIPKPDRPYGRLARALFARVPLLRRADRLRIYLLGELLAAALVGSPALRRTLESRWRSGTRGRPDCPGSEAGSDSPTRACPLAPPSGLATPGPPPVNRHATGLLAGAPRSRRARC